MTDDPNAITLPVSSPAAIDLGAILLGRYRLDASLGAGGMGAVWRAHDTLLARDVAIKVVHLRDALTRNRFVREARLAARLDHPGLARILDVADEGDLGFLVLELLSGQTLRARLAAGLPITAGLAIAADVARALAHAHTHAIVHRDLKPDNVFLDRKDGGERVVVIDFGLSFATTGDAAIGRVTGGDVAGGTPGYMAPEQARAQSLGPPADVYALGCLLFELYVGRLPFEGNAPMVMSQHVYAAPPIAALADVAPASATALVTRMLAKAPGERPAMRDVATACDELAAQREAGPVPVGFGRGKLAEDRAHRMLTLHETTHAAPDGPSLGTVAVIGPVPDEVLVALAASGARAKRVSLAADGAIDGEADLFLVDAEPGALARLIATGRPVVATAPPGDVQAAVVLVRLGAADVVTRPIQPESAARKIERRLRALRRPR